MVASVVAFLMAAVGGAGAQGAGPTCPATLDGHPLSVQAPFSGTPRPVAGEDGEIASTSLRCTYGEGVVPAADLTLTWGDGCGDVASRSAAAVDERAVADAATALAESVGGHCAPQAAGVPWVPVGLGAGAATGALATILVLRRRRRALPAVAAVPPTAPEPVDLRPLAALFESPGGRRYVRTVGGQLAALAALALADGQQQRAELARTGSATTRSVPLPARPELAPHAVVLGG